MKVVLIHLDLGIGGAEMLVVNVACAMKLLGHDVKIFTSHHDENRCFEATKKGGTLGSCIEVHGDWIPRHIFGRFTAACAIIRMVYISFKACIGSFVPDVIFIDGVSSPVPIFQLFGYPVLFYCHFPDKLLCTDRSHWMKQIYRVFIDLFEENTTGCSDVILVNSKFTADIFRDAFSVLGEWCFPKVLYPTIAMPDVNTSGDGESLLIEYTSGFKHVFVSLNRYERKKNVLLALEAMSLLLENEAASGGKVRRDEILLVVAGGYDTRVAENVEYHQELVDFAHAKGISGSVIFRRSIGDGERNQLMRRASAILYTPANEHFGIVPIEAMSCGTPVIAVRSGGPLETVKDNVSGFLCRGQAEEFMEAMLQLITLPKLRDTMGENGIRRVQKKFTLEAMMSPLQEYLEASQSRIQRKRVLYFLHRLCCFGLISIVVIVALFYMIGAYAAKFIIAY